MGRGHRPEEPLRRPRAVQAVLGATQFLVLVDSLMVAVALPAIDRDLGLSSTELPWVVNAYTLALAGCLLVAGRAADLYGARRLLLVGLLGLTVATAIAAAAPSPAVLIAARAAQGAAAALAYPASLALVPTLFPRQPERGRTFAIVGIADGLGAVVGAVAGGVVAGLLGWRWVFIVTIPLGLGALLLARAVVPASERARLRRRLDVLGAVLVTTGITALVYAVIQLEHAGITGARVLVPFLAGLACLGAFVAVERRAAAPLMRPGLLRVRSLSAAAVGIAATSAVYSAVVVVGSLYLQQSRGYSALATGLAFVPKAVIGIGASFLGARLVERLGNRFVAVASLVFGAGAVLALGLEALIGAPYAALILPALLAAGIAGYGSWVALVGLAARDVDDDERAVASSVFEASIHVGGAVAVAVLLTTLAAASDGMGEGAAYSLTFLTGALLVAAGAVACAVLLRHPRRSVGVRRVAPTAAK
jgi:EmrB/QacA subfamily drug resistance transporter